MNPTWQSLDGTIRLYLGDCREVMPRLEPVETVVTDPPYGLEFMGKEWDRLGDIGKTSHSGFTEEPGFKSFRLACYSGSSNVKCGKCAKWKWDYPKRKCVCETPDFPNVKAHHSRIMQAWHHQWASLALEVLKPGGMMLAFGGTRTHHRLWCAVEDAGFEVRDTICWLYGSGFPKSLDISTALDKAAGAEREVVGPPLKQRGRTQQRYTETRRVSYDYPAQDVTAPATDAAKTWDGYGTALKPAYEPILVAMKPLDGTFAANAVKHGVAGMWIDGGRIGTKDDLNGGAYSDDGNRNPSSYLLGGTGKKYQQPSGRWPANVILQHHPECRQVGVKRVKTHSHIPRTGKTTSMFGPNDHAGGPSNNAYADPDGLETVEEWACHPDCPVRMLDEQSGERKSGGADGHRRASPNLCMSSANTERTITGGRKPDTGGASRFFYCAKASRGERERGLLGRIPCVKCGGLETKTHIDDKGREAKCVRNNHPTVKPLSLMCYLVRLTKTPTGGTVLDPFMGSGSTIVACIREGRPVIGIEQDKGSFDIAVARAEAELEECENKPKQLEMFA